jgi:hypothetical protein
VPPTSASISVPAASAAIGRRHAREAIRDRSAARAGTAAAAATVSDARSAAISAARRWAALITVVRIRLVPDRLGFRRVSANASRRLDSSRMPTSYGSIASSYIS